MVDSVIDVLDYCETRSEGAKLQCPALLLDVCGELITNLGLLYSEAQFLDDFETIIIHKAAGDVEFGGNERLGDLCDWLRGLDESDQVRQFGDPMKHLKEFSQKVGETR